MATWGLHMRMAETFLEKGLAVDPESFLIGNIGPDCGMPNEDWSKFDPPTEVSHWSDKGRRNIYHDKFYEAYLKDKIDDHKAWSFYVGYYVHLLTDEAWSKFYRFKCDTDLLYAPIKEDKKFIWTIKHDWYDLDHVYFRDNPESIFYKIFQHVKDFPNYLPYYPEGAIMRQVKHITTFYLKSNDNLDREYVYLTMDEMDRFMEEASEKIEKILREQFVS